MQPQQMAMELQVLRQENYQFAQMIKNLQAHIHKLKVEADRQDAFEGYWKATLTGYCSQIRASQDPFWKKDDATGVMAPVEGGPVWAAKMAFDCMKAVMHSIEGMVQAGPPEDGTQDPQAEPSPATEGALSEPEVEPEPSSDQEGVEEKSPGLELVPSSGASA
jgi:hypothetical protein